MQQSFQEGGFEPDEDTDALALSGASGTTRHGGHLTGISPEELDGFAWTPRRGPLPEQVVGRRLVGIHPASEVVQVVADARDLPGALVLDGPRGGGPRPGPGHCLPQQRGKRHSRHGRLVPPGGVLGGRHAGGDQGGSVSHGHAVSGARGAAARVPPLLR